MSWAWWDWPLTWLTNHHPSVPRLGHVTHKTYNVSSGTLNSTNHLCLEFVCRVRRKLCIYRQLTAIYDCWCCWNICCQVDYIIREATSVDNLAVLYEGWTPWVWKSRASWELLTSVWYHRRRGIASHNVAVSYRVSCITSPNCQSLQNVPLTEDDVEILWTFVWCDCWIKPLDCWSL